MVDVMKDRRTDYGPPHYEQFLPPVIKNNYGKWKYHELLKPAAFWYMCRKPATKPIRSGPLQEGSSVSKKSVCTAILPTNIVRDICVLQAVIMLNLSPPIKTMLT